MGVDPKMVPRLLANKNRLTRVEKDALLENILGAKPSEAKTPRGRWLWALASATAALALLPLTLSPKPEFSARSGADVRPEMTLLCAGHAPPCRTGEKLLFELTPTKYTHFAALSQRPDQQVLWYFPDSLQIAAHLRAGVLDKGVPLTADHPKGQYTIYGVFSTAPLLRDEIKARFHPERADLGPGTHVIKKAVWIQ